MPAKRQAKHDNGSLTAYKGRAGANPRSRSGCVTCKAKHVCLPQYLYGSGSRLRTPANTLKDQMRRDASRVPQVHAQRHQVRRVLEGVQVVVQAPAGYKGVDAGPARRRQHFRVYDFDCHGGFRDGGRAVEVSTCRVGLQRGQRSVRVEREQRERRAERAGSSPSCCGRCAEESNGRPDAGTNRHGNAPAQP